VAKGDLSQKITVDVKGEMLELKDTINAMVDQLSVFADEVTRVAKEVGTEGKLGGQADVPGVAGTWKALTHNVNQLAKTLTIQLRAIAEVSTAVTQGDLTRSITVQAEGEVAELKDNINQMIANLRDTTQRNAEQDWLKTNLAKISSMLQGQRDLGTVSRLIMSEVTPVASAQLGAFFMLDPNAADPTLRLIASYGYTSTAEVHDTFRMGEGLVGQSASEGKPILITDAKAHHLQITSGLVATAPVNVIVLPVLFEEQVLAVIELASLRPFTDMERTFLDQTMETIGVVLNTILANMRTEELLEQSQRLTQELQSQSRELQTQQDELRKTNAELQEKAALLSEQNRDIELKNREIELARRGVEEKAEQLALSSRYKSEFLANMSHELRTPLNSLLILTKLLADNVEENLTEQQIEFANTIYAAGSDLLELINDILDLSKVEAGKMDISPAETEPAEIRDYVERTFRPVAEEKNLDFAVEVDDDLPATVTTDGQRLQQVLRNLLSNAFKFTEAGGVTLGIAKAEPEDTFNNPVLRDAEEILMFSVTDTGIGVAPDKLQLIFEAFQQEDGTTSRRYGGTGLGLSISREIARLLGGEIRVQSEVGAGSTFTLYVPTHYTPDATPEAPIQDDDVAAVPFLTSQTAESVRSLPIRRPQPLPAERPRVADETLANRKILVVDDDVRNVFALTSALESYGMEVLFADNGKKGIDVLMRNPDVDLVLMDIMMPEMDGYETCRAVRSMPQFQRLPIISLTAKAMTGDREKSIASGASDYITKPVEIDQLLSLMRMWLTG
jgi:signal transduction histidine kinase/HAMP domain-containing protein